MEFCNKCDNIYYIEIIDGILSYKCKKCKNVVILDEINNKPYLIKTDIQKKKSSYEYIINEYTKYDNTLPRIKHIKCPRCSTKPSKQEPKRILFNLHQTSHSVTDMLCSPQSLSSVKELQSQWER